MKSNDIRQKFLDYFANKGHTIVSSSSLVPGNDPTLLFTNAGMVQFKEVFLGLESRSYSRATSSQRCVRAGGKHNDLDNVGFTARHHTFFEMLGNFSFGDYFKKEAIKLAWEFLTTVVKIPREKLWITVFRDDDEAAEIWLNEIKIDPNRLTRCDEKDNFWSMGETGPCGPCTEIFYDHGPSVAGGPPGSIDAEGDRYIEIWNIVFMQYDRSAEGELSLLPKPSVDTGMGLERIAAVLQGVHSNYDTDLFQPLIEAVIQLAPQADRQSNSLKVIADHIRSCAFLVADGVVPSNEGRGYVLRRIIRRAIRHGHKLGLQQTFFYKLVTHLAQLMKIPYPELMTKKTHIEFILKQEEEQFAKTLDQGLHLLEEDIAQLRDKIIPGETLFKLYDTFGFPVDLTADIAKERGLSIDLAGFEVSMAKQRSQSQQASQFVMTQGEKLPLDDTTHFKGYEFLEQKALISVLLKNNEKVNELKAGENGVIVLDKTPFYAESGGQIGDSGTIKTEHAVFKVNDTKLYGKAYLHLGVVESGNFKLNDSVIAEVNGVRRKAIMLNHSATHLLHAALRQELGEHVVQKGSLVNEKRLRFDFSHFQAVTPEQLHAIERIVNQKIRANLPAHVSEMSFEDAKKSGAIALFGEKYGDTVRVQQFGDFSKELCGGTHISQSGEIGFFKIVSESGIAAGVRRIEAITGDDAIHFQQQQENQLLQIAETLKSQPNETEIKLQQLIAEKNQLIKQVEQLSSKMMSSLSEELSHQAIVMNDVKVLVNEIPNLEVKILRQLFDALKSKQDHFVIVLITSEQQKINVVAGISKDLIGKVKPRELVATICGKGGGREDMAQGGGERPSDFSDRIEKVKEMIGESLKS